MKTNLLMRLSIAAGCVAISPFVLGQTVPYSGTAWLIDVPAPGMLATNTTGVFMKGGLQVLRAEASDARVSGRRQVFGQLAYNPDGTAHAFGYCYLEVGSWSGTNFTASGPLWELQWDGFMQTNNSLQLSISGSGLGGSIDGYRFNESIMRGPASGPYDPPIPFQFSGTIAPPPKSTNILVTDFNSGLDGWYNFFSDGSLSIIPTNGCLVLRSDVSAFTAADSGTSWAGAPNTIWRLDDHQTLETGVDLLSANYEPGNMVGLFSGNGNLAYLLTRGSNFVALAKWSPSRNLAAFWIEKLMLPPDNVRLSLSITRSIDQGILVARVFDTATKSLLLERATVDSLAVDPTMTTQQIQEALGAVKWIGAADGGWPILSKYNMGGYGIAMVQLATNSPSLRLVADNFSMTIHDNPPLAITAGVQVSWCEPAGVHYGIETSPTAQGPYVPLEQIDVPGMKRIWIPAGGNKQFFRQRQIP